MSCEASQSASQFSQPASQPVSQSVSQPVSQSERGADLPGQLTDHVVQRPRPLIELLIELFGSIRGLRANGLPTSSELGRVAVGDSVQTLLGAARHAESHEELDEGDLSVRVKVRVRVRAYEELDKGGRGRRRPNR